MVHFFDETKVLRALAPTKDIFSVFSDFILEKIFQ